MPTLLRPDRQVHHSHGACFDHDRQYLSHPGPDPTVERFIDDVAAYRQQFWNVVNAMRSYLLRHQPAMHRDGQPTGQHRGDPVGGGQPTASGPRGAAEDSDVQACWSACIAVYAEVISVLAGPHGDSGFGADESAPARRIATAAMVVGVNDAGAARWLTGCAAAVLPAAAPA